MNIQRWFVAILLLAAVIFGLGFIKFGQIQAAMAYAATFPEPSAAVDSTYSEKSHFEKTTKVIGQLQATQSLTISNEYGGVIVHVGFQPGDVVEKDQLLLTIDSSVEQANLSAAKARLVLANKTLARLQTLLKEKRVSQEQVDTAQADVNIAQSEVDHLSTIIRKKEIRAPFTGRVGLNQYHVGQLLDANSQITHLVGIDESIWVNFSVPQTLPKLSIGDTVSVTLIAANQREVERTAKVIAIHASIDPNSRQQSYRAELINTDNSLLHNQVVNVFVPLQRSDVVLVPTNSVTRNHFGEFVYQLAKDEDGNWRAKSVKVSLGNKVNDKQVVLSGLMGNELIASEGAFKLKDGLLVYTQVPASAFNSAVAGGK